VSDLVLVGVEDRSSLLLLDVRFTLPVVAVGLGVSSVKKLPGFDISLLKSNPSINTLLHLKLYSPVFDTQFLALM
jgi:hypothetical protein